MSTPSSANPSQALVDLAAADLMGPGVTFCPNPRMALWSNHPKVFIDVAKTGEGRCPYCGNVYRLRAAETVGAAH
ncbi:MAG: zinc-finger domain-containing protein [Rubrivivax sp.]|nr:zinc-finger domain-containing protein [Rubrivivax sp.]